MTRHDIRIADETCPQCGHETHWRPCTGFFCEEGQIDMHWYDSFNFMPGQDHTICELCNGQGYLQWCPDCGWDKNWSNEKQARPLFPTYKETGGL